MRQELDRDYHVRRAQEELDLAYRAESWMAINAHLRLSSLHIAKVRECASAAFAAPLHRAPSAARGVTLTACRLPLVARTHCLVSTTT